MFQEKLQLWYKYRTLWELSLLLSDSIRISLVILLLYYYFSIYYLIPIFVSVFLATAPSVIFFEMMTIQRQQLQQINSCCSKLHHILTMLIRNVLWITLGCIMLFFISYCFAATFTLYLQRKNNVKSFITQQNLICKYIFDSKTIVEIKYKLIAVNYIILNKP
eukprot:421087_1